MSFSGDVRRFNDRAMKRWERIRRGVTFKLFSAVLKDTPVGTSDPSRNYVGGRLRASWMLSVGEPDRSVAPVPTTTQTGSVGFALLDQINATTSRDVVWLSNSLPYASRIEHDGWSHTKSPQGMVRKNVDRFKRLLGEQLAELS